MGRKLPGQAEDGRGWEILSILLQPKECWASKGKEEQRKKEEKRRKREEEKRKNKDDDKKKRKSSKKLKENQPMVASVEEGGLARTDTYTKEQRKRVAAQLRKAEGGKEGRVRNSSYTKEPAPAQEPATRMTTSFREVADKKLRQETSCVLSRSGPNSPMSW